MAKEPMDAIALLKADHRKVEALFESFENAKGEATKKKLAEQICTELMIHSKIEEDIFYPACRGKIEDEDLLDEAYVEHDGAKVLINEIMAAEPDAEFYDAKVKVLSEMIKHHIKEEEKRSEGLMAQAKEAGLDIDALGEQLADEKKKLTAEFKADGLPTPEPKTFQATSLN
jgi:hemerythrin superfamily protein